MAAIEDALRARLQAVTAVTDLVAARVFHVKKSIGTAPAFPFLSYEMLSAERWSAMGSDPGVVDGLVRFHAWAKTTQSGTGSAAARDVSEAIRGALQRFRGTSASVEVLDVFVDGEYDIGDDAPGVFHRVMDFRCFWRE